MMRIIVYKYMFIFYTYYFKNKLKELAVVFKLTILYLTCSDVVASGATNVAAQRWDMDLVLVECPCTIYYSLLKWETMFFVLT